MLLKPTEGQPDEGLSGADMFDSVGPGQTLLAKRAHDSDGLRDALAERGAVANIHPMPAGNCFPALDPIPYHQRIKVERFFSKLKRFRAAALRYDTRCHS